MKATVKFELQPVSNGFLLVLSDWKEYDGVPIWAERKSEVHCVLEEALDSIRSFMDTEGMG